MLANLVIDGLGAINLFPDLRVDRNALTWKYYIWSTLVVDVTFIRQPSNAPPQCVHI